MFFHLDMILIKNVLAKPSYPFKNPILILYFNFCVNKCIRNRKHQLGKMRIFQKKRLAIDKIRIVNNYFCVVYLLACTVKYKLFCTMCVNTFLNNKEKENRQENRNAKGFRYCLLYIKHIK